MLSTSRKIKIHRGKIFYVVLNGSCDSRVSIHEWKLVSHIKGRTKAKDVWKQGAETIVGHKMVAETWGWRKLCDEKLHDLYSSPHITTHYYSNQSKCMKWVRLCGLYAGEEKCEKVFVGKPEGKRTFWRTRHKWVDCIKMNEKQGCRGTWATSSGSG